MMTEKERERKMHDDRERKMHDDRERERERERCMMTYTKKYHFSD